MNVQKKKHAEKVRALHAEVQKFNKFKLKRTSELQEKEKNLRIAKAKLRRKQEELKKQEQSIEKARNDAIEEMVNNYLSI